MNSAHFKIQRGSVTSPRGFRASGIRCGLKEKGEDLALIVSDVPAVAAALFTANRIKAAPILWCKKLIENASARAVIVNSGNANACTGEEGLADAEETAKLTAQAFGTDPSEVLVASTGIIGHLMPMDLLRQGIPKAVQSLSESGGENAARAIMTTDLQSKHFSTTFSLGEAECTIGVIAKGSGMINPNVATMICVITTDVDIEKTLLRTALINASAKSINALSVDGQMSTNDVVFILANGQSSNSRIVQRNEDFAAFQAALTSLSEETARAMAFDGEGATKLLIVDIEDAANDMEAMTAAKAVANSMLVKTAIFGQDPNWGRALSAVGASDVSLDPDSVKVSFNNIPVMQRGEPVPFNRETMAGALAEKEINIRMHLGAGTGQARVYSCDLTYDYIKINAEYHT